MTKECGTSSLTCKNALVWAIADSGKALSEDARKFMAWEAISDEEDELGLDSSQKRELAENLKKAQRDLTETVWRSYKNLAFLGKDNAIKTVDHLVS